LGLGAGVRTGTGGGVDGKKVLEPGSPRGLEGTDEEGALHPRGAADREEEFMDAKGAALPEHGAAFPEAGQGPAFEALAAGEVTGLGLQAHGRPMIEEGLPHQGAEASLEIVEPEVHPQMLLVGFEDPRPAGVLCRESHRQGDFGIPPHAPPPAAPSVLDRPTGAWGVAEIHREA